MHGLSRPHGDEGTRRWRYRSVLGLSDTVGALMERIPQHNWTIPDISDLQRLWTEAGVKNAPRIGVLYLCNANGGYEITKSDDMMAMSVMMPMGLSVYYFYRALRSGKSTRFRRPLCLRE